MLKQAVYRIKKIYHFFKTLVGAALPANIKYGFPSSRVKIIIITGTDGKTTSSTLLYHVLQEAGKKVALISTVAAYIGDKQIDTGFHVTTPTPWQLQKLIQQAVTAKCEYLILEATSQGIYQYRTWGIRPQIAGVTNITQDHFDYHLNFQNYLNAKLGKISQAKQIILNKDDASFDLLSQKLKSKKGELLTYSSKDKLPEEIDRSISHRFGQSYNQMNARLVWKISQLLDVDQTDFVMAIKHFPPIPGRMQEIENKIDRKIIVDFAHTPNGLREVLQSLQKQNKSGKLIAVYGCAGLRDANKRPQMGQIGVELADSVIFTAEDPRTEDVWSIIRQMKEQLTQNHKKILSIPDRYQAIAFAINDLSHPGDTILIAGKGHEQSMCYGKKEYRWSDVDAVGDILKDLKK